MGLLDEAIREHLDLKRRRGADPSEIERLEREALGPVRRGAHQAAGDVGPNLEPTTGGVQPDEPAAHDWDEPLESEPPFDHSLEPEPVPEYDLPYQGPGQRGYEAPRHHDIAEEWDAHGHHPFHGEPTGLEPEAHSPTIEQPPPPTDHTAEGPPPAPASAGSSAADIPPAPAAYNETEGLEAETTEYDVEAEHFDEPEGADEQEGEDVLEETPEFLQDTPDHDRLWFEQRPPRDFDFDG